MEVVNLLEFLNNAKKLDTLDYASYNPELINFLDIIALDEQFTHRIDMGIIYVNQKTLTQYTLIDGLSRILSLSLLLHAICECYKKTSARNDKAIRTIRKKYLLDGTKTKLRLAKESQVIYEKILYGERLSGREKEHPIFVLLHNFWMRIKEEKLQAANMFKMLQKIYVTICETENINHRDLYYALNKDKRELNQMHLIDNYMNSAKVKDTWLEIKNLYNNKNADIVLFFKDFLWNKFNFKEFDETKLYEYVLNYCETMRNYMKPSVVVAKIKRSAELYQDLLNVNMPNDQLKQAMIQIKLLNGEDTYAYLLNVYEDYTDGSISEATFVEILSTVQEYLKSRRNTPNNVGFNELIQYLNAFLACK